MTSSAIILSITTNLLIITRPARLGQDLEWGLFSRLDWQLSGN